MKRSTKARRVSGRKRSTAPSDDDDVHPLVLAVLQAVQHATAGRRPPFYVSVDDLDLAPDDPERNGAAIMLAELRGWLTTGGKPAHSVAITASGLALLKEKGMA
jgi:hypothetical protein